MTNISAIRDAILRDITDRRGWRQAWDDFDDDVREEIREAFDAILRPALTAERLAGRIEGLREAAMFVIANDGSVTLDEVLSHLRSCVQRIQDDMTDEAAIDRRIAELETRDNG